MITIPQPAMALNAEGVPGPDYKMWNTWRVAKTENPPKIFGWTATVARGTPSGKLKAVVINCHGRPAHLGLGTSIDWGDMLSVSLLSGLVDDIHIVACTVDSFTGSGDGNLFCGAIAKAANANVYASDHTQTTGLWPTIPYGKIDVFEGKVWKWHPDGSNEFTNL